jgi:hypothetical protein
MGYISINGLKQGLITTMFRPQRGRRFLTVIHIIAIFFIGLLGPSNSLPDDSLDPIDRTPIQVDADFDYRSISNTIKTRWASPDDSRPITYAEWLAEYDVKGPLEIIREIHSPAIPDKRDGNQIVIVVNGDLYLPTLSALELFVLDLTGEGYDVTTYYMAGGTPESLRSFLQIEYDKGMRGCLLIGDLPVPWYEIIADTDEFPCDLYYMDLDGEWGDVDSDGMFDSHSGDVAPEIYVGRLTTSPMTLDGADEIDLINNYFHKNHLYRCGLMPVENRALVYVDDDWAGPGWSFDMSGAYANRTTVYDEWTTWAPDYMNRLPLSYELINVYVHSWSGGHAFNRPSGESSWMYNTDIKNIQPIAHFYNLFACSNSRYVEPDYCGGWYIFGPDHGLASIGSTKSGSMLNFQDFYDPLGEGKEIGLAFQEWFVDQAVGGFAEWEITWFYGMTLCGDPTLRTQKKSNSRMLRFDNNYAEYMMALPHPSADFYNVRITPDQACTLSAVQVVGSFPEIPVRMYIWNSDGVYPTTVIDSVDVPDGDLGMIDLADRNMILEAGVDYHFGFTVLDPAPAETLWIYMDNGVDLPEIRSGMYHDGQWKTQPQFYGANYNFMIRAEVRYPDQPEITITTTAIPEGTTGNPYDESLEVEGGTPPYSWELTAGTLPDGLALDPSNGKIAGIPAAAGVFNFSVRATDSGDPALSDVQHLSAAFTFVCGDVNSDGQVNVADAVFVINYVFKGGPAPAVPDAADANCDGNVDVGDAVYLINYVFSGGPPPCCL